MTNEAILCILDHLCNEARNSMHAVLGLLELPPELIPDPRWQNCVETARASADRLLQAIDDVRELLASPAPWPETCREFDLSVCLRETVELLNVAGVEEGHPISLDATAAGPPVRQDRNAVEQVLIRVLKAARKLAGTDGVHIAAATFENGFRFRIGVSDAGAADRLADWLNVSTGEAGVPNAAEIPLAVAVMVAGRRIRAMGGAAGVARVENAGELVVTLPVARSTAAGGDGPPPQHALRPASLNVLMAEDCDESYALSELLLRDENVWRTRNGQEAVELIRKQRFDVVFMDVHMPGMDGYTAIRAIRDWETETCNARTPVVVLSSDDLETQRRCAAQSGCSGYLRKPLRNGELLELLKRLKAVRSLTA